jgi:aflatoxin B1 aldehyde reductase
VLHQAATSLANLQTERIDLFYLHGPDIKTPVDETLNAIEELHKGGKIVEFGLSNFPAWKVVDICKSLWLPLTRIAFAACAGPPARW